MNLINFDYVNERDKELTDLFINSDKKKYILGINKLTRSVIKHIEVDGIIDDFSRIHTPRKKTVLQISGKDFFPETSQNFRRHQIFQWNSICSFSSLRTVPFLANS